MDSAPRQYWQLPMFIMGVVAMASAYRFFPPPTAMAGERSQAAIAQVQQALVAKPNGWESVEKTVMSLNATLDSTTAVDSTTAFAVGSWHVSAAEYGKPADSKKHWEQAALRFTQVDAAALETVDAGRFTYRLAKVDAVRQVGKPNETLAYLLNPPSGEDTAFRGQYVYAAAMRSTPPDTSRAKSALNEFLTGPAAAKLLPTELAQYKFKFGELLLNDGQAADAKTWLAAATGPTADANLRCKAHMLLGRTHESLKDSKNAISSYQQALMSTGINEAEFAQIRMLCAEGLTRLDQIADAVMAYARAAQDKGPIGVAAACRLANLSARQPSLNGTRTGEVESLKKCFAALNPKGELDNPHVTIDDLRTTSEQVITACVKDADMTSAAQAMTLFEKVSSPEKAREVKADALQSLAYTTANRADPLNKAGELHRQAAVEFDALASSALTPMIKLDALRKAAQSYQAAGDRTAARQRLTDAAATPGLAPDMLATIRLGLAETTADPEQASTLLQQVIDAGGSSAFAARVKLGETKLDQANALIGQLATDANAKTKWTQINTEAASLLEQAANSATVTPLDQPAHERSLFLLGRLKLYQGKHADSISTLKSLLQRYPQTKDGEKAKLYLGSSLLVEGTNGTGNPAMIEESIAVLEPLMTNAQDVYVRSQSGLRVARAHLAGKHWQEAITAAMTTADQSKGRLEELIALSLAYNAYAEQKRPEQLGIVESRMRQVFQALPETAFNGTADEYRKSYWQSTWFDFFEKAKP